MLVHGNPSFLALQPPLPRALNAGIDDPPKEWRRPRGRPRQRWLRTVENDLKQQHLGLWSARHRAVSWVRSVRLAEHMGLGALHPHFRGREGLEPPLLVDIMQKGDHSDAASHSCATTTTMMGDCDPDHPPYRPLYRYVRQRQQTTAAAL